MKSPSGNVTFQRTTTPECFRAVATGVGNDIAQSKATGEVRKAQVRAQPHNTIAKAIPNEGFGADKGGYSGHYGTFGDADAIKQAGSFPPNSSR